MWIIKNRKFLLWAFGLLTLGALASLPYIKFSFDFEKFFPDNDPDLEFYKEFISEFESDDNFFLIALPNSKPVYDSEYLKSISLLTRQISKIENVASAISIPTLQRPSFGLMGFSFQPILDITDNDNLKQDFRSLIENNDLFASLVSQDHMSSVIALKVNSQISLAESDALLKDLDKVLDQSSFKNRHYLGRVYFQNELARIQATEIIYSSFFSVLLVSIILFLLYRNKYLVFITLCSITIGLILFMGVLSILGRELDALSALYPVLMLIVGCSDVIHILSKYLDELRKGNPIPGSIDTTIRQIGLATFFTSATTAIGFLSLITSKIGPVRNFGINAAIGVLVAYVTIIFFTTALLTFFAPEKLKTHNKTFVLWDRITNTFYKFSKRHRLIFVLSFFILGASFYGLTCISTDYKLESSLPRGEKVTEDFHFFEKHFAGYRPMEYAFFKKDNTTILDYTSLQTLNTLAQKINSNNAIEYSMSIGNIWKILASYFPQHDWENDEDYYIRIFPAYLMGINASPSVLINADRTKTRISAQIKDIGADSIKAFSTDLFSWINSNIDTASYIIRYTGTGLVIDKNAEYVRESLINGLLFALVIIGILMGLLFRSFKMLLLSLIPNTIPLIIAGAIMGYMSIPLDPLTSITFVVIFGIAVDDTIHFLSKYRLATLSGLSVEESIQVSFEESGKAILFTTVVLFFGFLVMLFSFNPSSVIVGGLISATLFTAVFADLILLPVLLRTFYKK